MIKQTPKLIAPGSSFARRCPISIKMKLIAESAKPSKAISFLLEI
ncbi:hypothetical protein [Polaribacter sp. M15]